MEVFFNIFSSVFLTFPEDGMCIYSIYTRYIPLCRCFISQKTICEILVCFIRNKFYLFRMIFFFWVFNQLSISYIQRLISVGINCQLFPYRVLKDTVHVHSVLLFHHPMRIGCTCLPCTAAAAVSGIFSITATRDRGFVCGASCRIGTK